MKVKSQQQGQSKSKSVKKRRETGLHMLSILMTGKTKAEDCVV